MGWHESHMTDVLPRGEDRDTMGEHHGKMEAGTGVMHLPAQDTKDCWLSPEDRREPPNRFTLRTLRRNPPC